MSSRDPKLILLDVFYRLRRGGFSLSIGELLAAYQAVDGGWGAGGPEALRQVTRLLWCHSHQEVAEFEEIYSVALAASTRSTVEPEAEKTPSEMPPPSPQGPRPELPPRSGPVPERPERETELGVLPMRTLSRPLPGETGSELRAYWPVSRRSMAYIWRYLRRPVKDGPRDVLNIKATVECAARQGFFLDSVYDRRETNHAHLVLLIDQGGSMVPFHRFTRDLIDTADEESSIQQVDMAYFHNVALPSVFRDPHLTEPVSLDQVLAECTANSSVLVVSDAGAARGYRSMDRIRATTEFLVKLRRRTTLIAWLNPMPKPRWASTSAQFIARLVDMFQMDPDGFSNAVDVLRDQPLRAHRWG